MRTPDGVSEDEQDAFFRTVRALNRERLAELGDPAIAGRIASYELAARMQASAPELAGSLARECRDARAVRDRGRGSIVRAELSPGAPFGRTGCALRAALPHRLGPPRPTQTNHLGEPLEARCREVDRASAALVLDLERLGLLEETVVLWGGEFGRTPMSEVRKFIGRDHHIEAFTLWMAGAGVRPGTSYGQTDEIGYSVVDQEVHVHDLHATLLHLLGIDHERLTYRFQGLGLPADRRARPRRARDPDLVPSGLARGELSHESFELLVQNPQLESPKGEERC